MTFPSIPGWDGIHPVVVQFSIVLLWVAPLYLLVSLFSRQAWRTWMAAGLLAMGLGTLAAWLAVASGHAAGQLVDKTPAIAAAIAQHEALGLLTRNLFTGLTLVLAALMIVARLWRKPLATPLRVGVQVAFILACIVCTMVVANTASRGGLLVHEQGVRALVGTQTAVAAPSPGSPTVPATTIPKPPPPRP